MDGPSVANARITHREPDDTAVRPLIDQIVAQLLGKLKSHHPATHEHSCRVAGLVRELGGWFDLPDAHCMMLVRAGLLHDLGKVTVPRSLLDKPAALTINEWACMDRHSDVGAELLNATGLLASESYIVRHHHRWFAANNALDVRYDSRLDRAIDLLAVCDAYDAMVSDRPYNCRRERCAALEQLENGAGDQFCPRVVVAFRDMIHERSNALRQ